MNIVNKWISVGLAMCVSASVAFASDKAKEQRWKDQIVEALLDGEAVDLTAGKDEFLTIYTESQDGDKTYAAIVAHGSGVHPDWPQVIQPLRVGLTEHGWSTLSVQLPILANDAEYHEYAPLYKDVAPRMEAAITYLQEQGHKHIVVIAHSLGASMTSYYLRQPNKNVSAFVGIGMSGGGQIDAMNDTLSLAQITSIPVLDLYGSDDNEGVLKSTEVRAAAGKTNAKYKQVKVDGANHFFDDKEAELVEIVSGWLKK